MWARARAAQDEYPCKFDNAKHNLCSNYDPRNYSCTHGGGTGCRTWKNKTNLEIGSRKLPGEI